jgi:hypothetical protein
MPRPVPRHDRDAGGPAEVLAAKAALRQEVWSAMRAARVARFPGAAGRIPNFTGAEAAAERLRATPAWQAAGPLKANPDSAQLPVRQRALEDGKTVYMAVHELQLVEPGTIPVTSHDVPVDLIVTPDRVIDCRSQRGPRPAVGIRWEDLTEEKIAAIPLLSAQRASRTGRGSG